MTEAIPDGTVVKRKVKHINSNRIFHVEASSNYWKIKCPDGATLQQENKATTERNLNNAKKKIVEIYGGPTEEI